MEKTILSSVINPILPEPIAFFAWKHHLNFIVKSIERIPSTISPSQFDDMFSRIKGTIFDLYIGDLSPEKISSEIPNFLKQNDIWLYPDYIEWLKVKHAEYQMVTISDGSSWTLRQGKNQRRYVHIHPSRYSVNSLRVKPTTIKTAIAAAIFYPSSLEQITTEKINSIRANYLKLSPLKIGVDHKSILKILRYFYT